MIDKLSEEDTRTYRHLRDLWMRIIHKQDQEKERDLRQLLESFCNQCIQLYYEPFKYSKRPEDSPIAQLVYVIAQTK